MMQLFLYWVAIVAVNSFSLAPLQDSIIEVSVECGDRDTTPVLKILTDVEISAKAKCNGGDQDFTSDDFVHYKLPGAIVSDGSSCLFYQRENSDHYAVEVMVHYGEHGGLILPKEKIVSVICNYGGAARDGSPTHRIIDGPIAPIEIQTIVGATVPDNELSMSIQTVEDVDAVSPIALDRRYSLYGLYTGARSDVGLKPVSCDAVSNSGERYSVLRAGCGDGMIFDRSEGFTTTGISFRSPYFFAFHLSTSTDLNFECNVTLCTPSCDGSSCETDCGTLTEAAILNTELGSCTGQKLGDTCTFQCATGFDRTGDGIATCREDGIWTIPTITCDAPPIKT